MVRVEQPNVSNDLSINQLKQIVDGYILPINFNSKSIVIELDILGEMKRRK